MPGSTVNDALKYGFWQYSLYLAATAQKPIPIPGGYFADDSLIIDFDGLGMYANVMAYRGRGEMIDAQMGANTFLILLKVWCKDLPRG